MTFPFEASSEDLAANLDAYAEVVRNSLESEFLVMPRGPGFVEYARFSEAYETLRSATSGFSETSPEVISSAIDRDNLAIVVLRSVLGFTPSEWAHVATRSTGTKVDQNYCRTLDRRARVAARQEGISSGPRVKALIGVACKLLAEGVPQVDPSMVHRLDKADTRQGWSSVKQLSDMGAPYAMLLYERFLGRPFAGHRDAVSELVGGGLEAAIEQRMADCGVPFRKTKRAEKLAGFDQAPDFVIPDEFNPSVVIEAKLTEDDGTARDKVTRVQHLAQIAGGSGGKIKPFQVVAVIAGRGFAVRKEDMRKLLLATNGKVFTLKTLDRLVEFTQLSKFAIRTAGDASTRPAKQ